MDALAVSYAYFSTCQYCVYGDDTSSSSLPDGSPKCLVWASRGLFFFGGTKRGINVGDGKLIEVGFQNRGRYGGRPGLLEG